MEAAWEYAHAKENEAKILSEMQSVIFEGGGDYPANEFIIGSGKNALLCRYQSEKRKLDEIDQLSIEWAGTYKHYHSAMFRTIPIGKVNDKQKEMYSACLEALKACENKLKPGNKIGEVFDIHAEVFRSTGIQKIKNECLRLFSWNNLCSQLDGLAYAIYWKPGNFSPGHDFLYAYDFNG